MANPGEVTHMVLSPPRPASPTPSNTSRRHPVRPPPEEAFDAIVQAANPAHPDHSAWLERFGGSASSPPLGVGGGSGSRRGSAVKTRSEAGSVRATMGSVSGFGGAEYLFGAESPPPVKRGVSAPSHDGSSLRSGAETPKRRRKKRKDGTLSSKDKGKAKALPPPIPPPRTTSAMLYHPPPPIVQPEQTASGATEVAKARPLNSTASSVKSKRSKRKGLPLPAVPSSPVRQRTSSISGGKPELPVEVPPVPSSPLVTFARAPVGTAAHRQEMLATETVTPPMSPSDVSLPHSPVSLSTPLGRPESRANSLRERSGVAAIRRSLESVMAPFKGSASSRKAKEAAAAQEVIDRMASATSSHGHSSQSPQVGAQVATPTIVATSPLPNSAGLVSPALDASTVGESSARSPELAQAAANASPPIAAGARRTPRVVRPFASNHMLAGSSASRPLSSVKDVRESGTEAEADGFFDARSEDDGAVSAPLSTDDYSVDEGAVRKSKPSPSLEQAQRSADSNVTVLRPTGELKQRRSNNSVATARAARSKLNSKDSPLLAGPGSARPDGSTAGESSADEEFFPVPSVGAQRPASMRRQRSASSQAERVNLLQTERALVAQAQAIRRATRERQGSANASASAPSPVVNADTPATAEPSPLVSGSVAAAPASTDSHSRDQALTSEERRQRLAAIEYFIPPVRPGSASSKPVSVDASATTQRLRTASSVRSLGSGYRAPGAAHEVTKPPDAPTSTQPLPLQSRQQPNGTPVIDSNPASPASGGKSTPRGLSGFLGRVKGNRSASKQRGVTSPSLTNLSGSAQVEADAPSVSSHNAKLQGLGIASAGSGKTESSGWRSRMPSFGTNSAKGKSSGQWSRGHDTAATVSPEHSPAPEEGRRDVLAQVVALSLASPKAGADSVDSHRPIEHQPADPSVLEASAVRPNDVSHLLGFRKAVPVTSNGTAATIHKSLSPALLNDSGRHEADDISSTGHVTDEDPSMAVATAEGTDGLEHESYDINEGLDAIDELRSRAAPNGTSAPPFSPPKVRLVRSSVDVHSGSDGGHTLLGYATSNGASSPVSHFGRHAPTHSMADSTIAELVTAPPSGAAPAPAPQARTPSIASRRFDEEIESLKGGDVTVSTSPRSRTPSFTTGRPSFAESRRSARQGAPLTIGISPRTGFLDSFRKTTSGKKGSKSQPTTPRLRGISSADHFAEPMPSATGLAAVENATRLLAAQADQMQTPTSYAFSNLNGTDTVSTPTESYSNSNDAQYGLGLGSLDMEPPPTPPTHVVQERQRTTSIGTRSLKSVQTHATSPEIDAFAEFLRASAASDAARRAGIAQRAAFAAHSHSQSQPASPR